MKQVIILRKDLNMRKGKMVAQGAHASVNAVLQLSWEDKHPWLKEWMETDWKKVVVSVSSEEELRAVWKQFQDLNDFHTHAGIYRDEDGFWGIPYHNVYDRGLTEFHGKETWTALAIGPAPDDLIDPITGHLPLL